MSTNIISVLRERTLPFLDVLGWLLASFLALGGGIMAMASGGVALAGAIVLEVPLPLALTLAVFVGICVLATLGVAGSAAYDWWKGRSVRVVALFLGISILLGAQPYKFEALLRSGDVLEGRTIHSIGGYISANQEEVVVTGKLDSGDAVFTNKRVIADEKRIPGFRLDSTGTRLRINESGNVAFLGRIMRGRDDLGGSGIFVNNKLLLRDHTPGMIGIPLDPYINNNGRVTFRFNSGIYSVNPANEEVKRETPPVIEGFKVLMAGPHSINEAGEIAFFSWLEDGRAAIFTQHRLVSAVRQASDAESTRPFITDDGRVVYLKPKPDGQSMDLMADDVALNGVQIPITGGIKPCDIAVNGHGTILIQSRSGIFVVRKGQKYELFGNEMMRDIGYWSRLMGHQVRWANFVYPAFMRCALNEADEVACAVEGPNESAILLGRPDGADGKDSGRWRKATPDDTKAGDNNPAGGNPKKKATEIIRRTLEQSPSVKKWEKIILGK